jgi:hypothetical protein
MLNKDSFCGGRQHRGLHSSFEVEKWKAQPGIKAPVEANQGMEATEMTMADVETELRDRVQKAGGGSVEYVHPPRRMRAVGYVRQGFGEVDRRRTSPEGQKARIAGCADAKEWHLIHTYEDIGWSGDDLDRPGLLAALSNPDFEILIVDRTDRLTCKKKDLNFLMALLEKHGVTCVPATWSWEPLAQYMRWWYRLRGNLVYALLDASPAGSESNPAKGHSLAAAM